MDETVCLSGVAGVWSLIDIFDISPLSNDQFFVPARCWKNILIIHLSHQSHLSEEFHFNIYICVSSHLELQWQVLFDILQLNSTEKQLLSNECIIVHTGFWNGQIWKLISQVKLEIEFQKLFNYNYIGTSWTGI